MRAHAHRLALVCLALAGCGPGAPSVTPYPPGEFGPHAVGHRMLEWTDPARDRPVTTALWYPARPADRRQARVLYLALLEGRAVEDQPADRDAAPYPLIVFSHGNQGLAVQSPSLCEHLAAQGFVVAAPTHHGNTLFDSPSDEEMAQIALDRPLDVLFAAEQLLATSTDPNSDLFGLVDPARIGVAGHSFGGYTALIMAGATLDVDAAAARCDAGLAGDVFCPAIAHMPAGQVLARPNAVQGWRASLALAPGSWGAFGAEGLASVDMPVLLMGGTADEFTQNDLRPIYQALPAPKAKLELERAGHMAFTDICRMNLPVPELLALCDPATHLDTQIAFAIIHTFAAAFFRYRLAGEPGLDDWLVPAAADAWPEAALDVD